MLRRRLFVTHRFLVRTVCGSYDGSSDTKHDKVEQFHVEE